MRLSVVIKTRQGKVVGHLRHRQTHAHVRRDVIAVNGKPDDIQGADGEKAAHEDVAELRPGHDGNLVATRIAQRIAGGEHS